MRSLRLLKPLPLLPVLFVLGLAGCVSYGPLGVATKSSVDSSALLKSGRPYEKLGPVSGKSCRYFLLGVFPWGNSTLTAAMQDALAEKGGDALIDVAEMNSLYTYIYPINLFSYSCTHVKGIAVKFQ